MRAPAKYVTALTGVIAVSAIVALDAPPATREGQVLFLPSSSVEPPNDPNQPGTVEVWKCRSTAEGLIVEGLVESEPGSVTVVVSGGDHGSAGVRVGRAFLSHSRAVGEAQPGRFRVLLPWATLDSGFAVAANSEPDAAHGAIASCP